MLATRLVSCSLRVGLHQLSHRGKRYYSQRVSGCKRGIIGFSSALHLQAKFCKSASQPARTKRTFLVLAQRSHYQAIDLPVVQEIASPANSYIKHCCKLTASRPYREQAGSVLVVGRIPVQEIAAHTEIRVLFLAQGASAPAGESTSTMLLHETTNVFIELEAWSMLACILHPHIFMHSLQC